MSTSHRRALAAAAAVLTAAALGTTAFVLPATADAGGRAAGARAAAETFPILSGTLDWGVRGSYRNYVEHTAQGTITVKDGATKNADGTFRFSGASGTYDKAGGHVLTAKFLGSVTFHSTHHGFTVTLANLRFDSGTKKLLVDVTRNDVLTRDVHFADVAFAGMNTAGLKTTLTQSAADLLGNQSYAGEDGDPLSAALDIQQPSPTTSTSGSSSPAPTTSTSTSAGPTTSTTSAAPTTSTSATGPTPSTTGATPSQGGSTTPVDGPQQILSGKLAWGVKESLRTYVGDGGAITPEGGAAKNGDSFSFGGGTGTLDAKAQKLNASFQGSLRFQRPDHGVDLSFANVRINAEGAKGTLVLDMKNGATTKTGISFATLDLTTADYKTKNGVLTLNAVRTALTAEGAAAFSRNGGASSDYKAGVRFDDVNLSVSVDKDATLPTTGGSSGGSSGGSTTGGSVGGSAGGSVGGNLASTGSEIPAGALLGASGAVIAAGAGAVYIARRRRGAAQN
ncbi:HtaA domain-containing protein [Streptomyces sp. NBC_00249]|uniref:HtaA domain-containing protein n=1 Tax=Streptomyces sp. NBC_00249 TaxID=2975690 RepID=UPI00225A354E|nr:HtaA domain-containing protein [Streptomyces sp. NBC_00249]MCX5196970.1 HtaA domain-containing protein [Streptomyces sp. NBC_00249]